jgi:hypothetical protein
LGCFYNTRAMLQIRHLLAQRLTNPAVVTLLLLVVAFRLLLPPGLMLSPSTGTAGGDLAICSGHGALFGSAISATPAAKAAAENLAKAFTSSTRQADHPHAGDLCPFSAALAVGLATTLPVRAHWLHIAVSAKTARPADGVFPAAAPTRGQLGARAPPFPTLV